MKHKYILITFYLFAQLIFAQIPTTCRLFNYNRTAPNQLEFSVYLKNTSNAILEYAGGQFGFDFNQSILNGGTGTFTIVETGLGTLAPRNPVVYTQSPPYQLRAAAPAPPGQGNGYKILAGDSVLVGKFRLSTSAASFTQDSSLISWRIPPKTGWLTKFGAYINSLNTDITADCTFFELTRTATSVEEIKIIIKDFYLGQNYPNPFNPSTRISFAVPKASHVTIEIFTISGEKIRSIVDGEFTPGHYEVIWDGRSSNGNIACSGIYIYKMSINGNMLFSKKMILSR